MGIYYMTPTTCRYLFSFELLAFILSGLYTVFGTLGVLNAQSRLLIYITYAELTRIIGRQNYE